METKAKAKVRAKPDIAKIAEGKDTSEWIDHTSVPTAQMKLQRREKPEELASLEAPNGEG